MAEPSLIERLRSHGTALYRPDHPTGLLLWEAASTLEDQARLIASLPAAIEHGDEEHRAWLHEAIAAHFAGESVPPPKGKGRKDALIGECREVMTEVHAAMLNGGDGAVGDYGWSITKLNKARPSIRAILTKLKASVDGATK